MDDDPRLADSPPDILIQFPSTEELDFVHVDVVVRAADWPCSDETLGELNELVKLTVGMSGVTLNGCCEVTVALSSDEEVRGLNADYRGKDKATNVLSFPVDGSVFAAGEVAMPLGDVILSYETVLREAQELALPFTYHLYHLTVHGVLHLLGFDHETDEAAGEMEKLESRILLWRGYHDPYSEAKQIVKLPDGGQALI